MFAFFCILTLVTTTCSGYELPAVKIAGCLVAGWESYLHADCTESQLEQVPEQLPNSTRALDLGKNLISDLPERAFSRFEKLQELRLAHNRLASLPPHVFDGAVLLSLLRLDNNPFLEFPLQALQSTSLRRLKMLHLENTTLTTLPSNAFQQLKSLENLWLDMNHFKTVPSDALRQLHSLQNLHLSSNELVELESDAFKGLINLRQLFLNGNSIKKLADDAFHGLYNLNRLELARNDLQEIPYALAELAKLQVLYIQHNKIRFIPNYAFIRNPLLKELVLIQNPLLSVDTNAFTNLSKLLTLSLSEIKDQTHLPDLTGCIELKDLTFDRASIEYFPDDLCQHTKYLKKLDVHSNKIGRIPVLSSCTSLFGLNLGNNRITVITESPFKMLEELHDLSLANNRLTYLPADAFKGIPSLQYLDLKGNMIQEIHPNAFSNTVWLEDLNLSNNQFYDLPTDGLQHLKRIKITHNRYMKNFPEPAKFPEIEYLALSYAYHCCEYIRHQQRRSAEEEDQAKIEEKIELIDINSPHITMFNATLHGPWIDPSNVSYFDEVRNKAFDSFGHSADKEQIVFDVDKIWDMPEAIRKFLDKANFTNFTDEIRQLKPPIKCEPMPGPFMPCDDLMGWWALRCGVWVVFLMALMGNGVVLFVSVVRRAKMDVPRFLICNLAVADLFMGIYLGFLAVVDASTLGEFKKSAIKWQYSPACMMAGVLGVLSSELSVYTLTVITIERFYAITHAMHLNKRLSIRHAAYIMMFGWCLAFLLAALPLFGVSDYRKFSVCLPFEIGDAISLGYVIFVMLFNMTAFTIIVSCYMKMYCSVRGSQAWNSNDSRVAKRMALLVFTDFACWAPISFFSITAACGLNLISLDDAKVFTIFVLPLNSCANPFLYAIFTKQFKKDCTLLCRRLEESTLAHNITRLQLRSHGGFSMGSSNKHLNGYVDEPHNYSHDGSNEMSGGYEYANGQLHLCHLNRVQNSLEYKNSSLVLSGATQSTRNVPSTSTVSYKRKRGLRRQKAVRYRSRSEERTTSGPTDEFSSDSVNDISNEHVGSLLMSLLNARAATQNSEHCTTDNEGDNEMSTTSRQDERKPSTVCDKTKRRPHPERPNKNKNFWDKIPKLTKGDKDNKRKKRFRAGREPDCLSSSSLYESSCSSENNNHDYMNVTEEMIAHVRYQSPARRPRHLDVRGVQIGGRPTVFRNPPPDDSAGEASDSQTQTETISGAERPRPDTKSQRSTSLVVVHSPRCTVPHSKSLITTTAQITSSALHLKPCPSHTETESDRSSDERVLIHRDPGSLALDNSSFKPSPDQKRDEEPLDEKQLDELEAPATSVDSGMDNKLGTESQRSSQRSTLSADVEHSERQQQTVAIDTYAILASFSAGTVSTIPTSKNCESGISSDETQL